MASPMFSPAPLYPSKLANEDTQGQGGYQIRTSDQILSNIQAWSQNSLRIQKDCVSFLEPSEKEFLLNCHYRLKSDGFCFLRLLATLLTENVEKVKDSLCLPKLNLTSLNDEYTNDLKTSPLRPDYLLWLSRMALTIETKSMTANQAHNLIDEIAKTTKFSPTYFLLTYVSHTKYSETSFILNRVFEAVYPQYSIRFFSFINGFIENNGFLPMSKWGSTTAIDVLLKDDLFASLENIVISTPPAHRSQA